MPARFRDIIRVLAAFDVKVEPGARHFRCEKTGFRVYTIPAHNGLKTEISDMYIRGLCKHFGIDVEKFKALL